MADTKERPHFNFKLTRYALDLDPDVEVLHVEITDHTGVWTESYGSEELMRAFLRGFTAASAMLHVHTPIPEIPRQATRMYLSRTQGEEGTD